MFNQSASGHHRAFTLVELLVVIGIIGILSGIILASFSGSTASARAARCLTNMRNLSAAVQTYGMAHGHYPLAGSVEKFEMDVSKGKRNIQMTYEELSGWVSWYSHGAYSGSSKPTSSQQSKSWNLSTYEKSDDSRLYCLTNGALWKYISGNREVYRCPEHARSMSALNPNWSYVMNAYFGCTGEAGTELFDDDYWGRIYGRLDRADRILLFAEIPFANIGVEAKTTTSAGTDCDCILQYDGYGGSGDNETIGVNHVVGKQTFAHVCFADGHCEKLVYPTKKGMTQAELQELTKWLCTGVDVGFDGTKYDKLTNTDDD